MSAQYLIRFDDICPTMNWPVWQQVEAILLSAGVKPLLAVVPDNQHAELKVAAPNPNFWSQVRLWQERGWSIGLHGYQHLEATQSGGILNVNPWSEFSGLSHEEQTLKLQRALGIFESHGVHPELWIAPAHSFDTVTLRALRHAGIHCLSDGFSLYPYRDSNGIIWVPQQFWHIRRMPFGLWTICFHVNHWGPAEINAFRAGLGEIAEGLTDWQSVVSRYGNRKRSLTDRIFSRIYPAVIHARSQLRRT